MISLLPDKMGGTLGKNVTCTAFPKPDAMRVSNWKEYGQKRLAAEKIVTKLRQIEVQQAQGKMISGACKEAGTTEQLRMSSSMARSSTVSRKPKWSSRNGASMPTFPRSPPGHHHIVLRQVTPIDNGIH